MNANARMLVAPTLCVKIHLEILPAPASMVMKAIPTTEWVFYHSYLVVFTVNFSSSLQECY